MTGDSPQFCLAVNWPGDLAYSSGDPNEQAGPVVNRPIEMHRQMHAVPSLAETVLVLLVLFHVDGPRKRCCREAPGVY
jgi:hypothetical protein